MAPPEALSKDQLKPGWLALRKAINDALAADRAQPRGPAAVPGADESKADRALAERVDVLLRERTAGIASAAQAARRELAERTPWAHRALESRVDLLSPAGGELKETAHTQTLSYFLNPAGAHGLASRPLRQFFKLLGRIVPGRDIFESLARDDPGLDGVLERFTVRAEYAFLSTLSADDQSTSRCDLWIEYRTADRAIVVAVENKVEAGEHGDQLQRYESGLREHVYKWRVPESHTRLVFLTPFGQSASLTSPSIANMSYAQLAAALALACEGAPEPGASQLCLYVASILRHVLEVPPAPRGLEYLREAAFVRHILEAE